MLTHVADVSVEKVRKMSPIYQRFYNDCLISNLTDMEKKIYVRNVLEYADVKESLMCERKYGRELGREEGLEQGREEERHQLALNMIAEGLAPDVVARITELTEEEVLALAHK